MSGSARACRDLAGELTVDRDQTKSAQKRARNQNVVSFWLDDEDYERLTHAAASQGVSRKRIFTDLLHERYRPAFPILSALSAVVATALALAESGADDVQVEKLRREVDRLAHLALAEVGATPDLPE